MRYFYAWRSIELDLAHRTALGPLQESQVRRISRGSGARALVAVDRGFDSLEATLTRPQYTGVTQARLEPIGRWTTAGVESIH